MTGEKAKDSKAGPSKLSDEYLDQAGGVPSFSELQGITTKVDVIEHRESMPGRKKPSDLSGKV